MMLARELAYGLGERLISRWIIGDERNGADLHNGVGGDRRKHIGCVMTGET